MSTSEPTPIGDYRILPDDTPTQPRRIYVNAVVGDDGKLRLELPVGERLARLLLTVTVQFDEPLPDTPPDHEWQAFIERTAGSSPDFPLDVDEGYEWDEEETTTTSQWTSTNSDR